MSTQLGERQTSASEGRSWRLRNWRVRARLVSLILIPTAAAVLLGAVQMFASTGAAADYARTNQLAVLSDEVGELTHQLARERAQIAWYVARGRPQSGSEAVREQIGKSDAVAKTVRTSATALASEVTGRANEELEVVLTRLGDLADLRSQALKGALLPGPAVELYTTIVSDLLSVHDELSKGTDDDQLFRQTQLLDALARAKESVSRQQALLTIVLQAGRFEQEQFRAFLGELSREQNERKAFSDEATADERRFFDEHVNAQSTEQMLFLRELVLIRATNGLPLRGLDLSRGEDAQDWFAASGVMVDAMRTVERRQSTGIVELSARLSADESQRAYVIAGSVLGLLIAVLLVTTGVARSLVRPLRRLRGEALEIAGRRLPEFVQRLRESRDGGVSVEVPPIGIFSKDEVGEVARAFDEVHREAVRLAGDEARLRSNVNAMFVNLSRRSQTLVERQLTLIERLERGERDDTRLGDLFKLDHLATRMRRNSENLLVLAGQEAARKWSEPVELMDVVRAALGEVESYDRVSTQVQSETAIAGQAVSDVVHLLAELIENAVSFSANDTKVIIGSSRIDNGGLMVSVTDQGIAMSQEEMAQANQRLASPPVVDVSVSRRMGLFVVGRLALRHQIRVQLRRQDVGGLSAMVLIPESLLSEVAPLTPAPGSAGEQSLFDMPAFSTGDVSAYPSGGGTPSYASGGHDPGPSIGGGLDSGQFGAGRFDADLLGRNSFDLAPRDPSSLTPGPFDPGSLDRSPLDPSSLDTGTFNTGSLGTGAGSTGAGSTGSNSAGSSTGAPSFDAHGTPVWGHPSLDAPLTPEPEPSSWFASTRSDTVEPGPLPYTPKPVPPAAPQDAVADAGSSWFTKSAPTNDQKNELDGIPAQQERFNPGESRRDLRPSPPEQGTPPAPPEQSTTATGLPKRTPKANLLPGSAAPAQPVPPPPPIAPDRLRSRLSSYQQGVKKGRSELEENP
ncbi:sensor histidine kinase [Nonomuraea longicatena]|uniref:histidine kinase n=1 Tax=Nonomuraea longicatena TaxID=83682 RepID=A0ABP3ZYB4_9ACTN